MSVAPAMGRPECSHARPPPAACVATTPITKAMKPAPAHVARYPVVKATGSSRDLLIREYSATVGETDGNIIAAIITTQTPRNQPNAPRPVHGPLSIPRISPTVHHHPAAASANRTATSPSWAREAANAGRSPEPEADSTSV